jgi:hypothetical protein
MNFQGTDITDPFNRSKSRVSLLPRSSAGPIVGVAADVLQLSLIPFAGGGGGTDRAHLVGCNFLQS